MKSSGQISALPAHHRGSGKVARQMKFYFGMLHLPLSKNLSPFPDFPVPPNSPLAYADLSLVR